MDQQSQSYAQLHLSFLQEWSNGTVNLKQKTMPQECFIIFILTTDGIKTVQNSSIFTIILNSLAKWYATLKNKKTFRLIIGLTEHYQKLQKSQLNENQNQQIQQFCIIKFMQKLLQAKNAVQAIEASFQHEDQLWENCQKFREMIREMDQSYRHEYELFLVDIYTSRLDKIQQALRIALALQKDSRPEVRMQGNLRLAHINLLKQKYMQANVYLQKIKPSSLSLQQIFSNSVKTLFISSKYCYIFQGMKLQIQGKIEQALSKYEFQLKGKGGKGKGTQNINKFAKMRINNLKNGNKPQKSKLNSTGYKKKQVFYEQDQLQTGQYKQIQKFIQQLITKSNIREQENLQEEMEGLKQEAKKKLQLILKELASDKKKYKSQVKQYLQKMSQALQGDIGVEFYYILKQFVEVKKQQEAQQQQQLGYKNKGRETFDKSKSHSINASQKFKNFQFQSEALISKQKAKNSNNFNQEIQSNSKGRYSLTQSKILDPSPLAKVDPSNFSGSYMIKIHEGSDGSQKRYFYFDRKEIKDKKKIKLYYNQKQKDKQKSSDEYYDITNFKTIIEGKKSEVFERSSCKKYEENQCFTIQLDKKSRSFYVPNLQDYQKWMQVLQVEAKQMFRTSGPQGNSKVSRISKKADFN